MLWIWSYPVSTKKLFLKIAVPKRQTKSLKSNYYIFKLYRWNLLRTIFSQVFLKDFAKAFLKDFADFPLYGIVKNLISTSQKLFDIFLSINLQLFSLFYQNFGSALFKEHLPVVVSANTCLKLTPKKLKQFSEIIYKCRKYDINSL